MRHVSAIIWAAALSPCGLVACAALTDSTCGHLSEERLVVGEELIGSWRTGTVRLVFLEGGRAFRYYLGGIDVPLEDELKWQVSTSGRTSRLRLAFVGSDRSETYDVAKGCGAVRGEHLTLRVTSGNEVARYVRERE